MSGNFEWTGGRREALRARWARGETGTEIGDAFGISRSAVLAMVRRMGLKRADGSAPAPRMAWAAAEVSMLRGMQPGCTAAEIARALPGRTPKSVEAMLARLRQGHVPAPPGTAPPARVPAPPTPLNPPVDRTPARCLSVPVPDGGVIPLDFAAISNWARAHGIAFDGGNVDVVNRRRESMALLPFVVDHTRP